MGGIGHSGRFPVENLGLDRGLKDVQNAVNCIYRVFPHRDRCTFPVMHHFVGNEPPMRASFSPAFLRPCSENSCLR